MFVGAKQVVLSTSDDLLEFFHKAISRNKKISSEQHFVLVPEVTACMKLIERQQ